MLTNLKIHLNGSDFLWGQVRDLCSIRVPRWLDDQIAHQVEELLCGQVAAEVALQVKAALETE